jgi:hypothetical protein
VAFVPATALAGPVLAMPRSVAIELEVTVEVLFVEFGSAVTDEMFTVLLIAPTAAGLV